LGTQEFYDLFGEFVRAIESSKEESLLRQNTPLFKAYWEFISRADDAVIKGALGGVEGSGE